MRKKLGILFLLAISAIFPLATANAASGMQSAIVQQEAPRITVSQGTLTITASPDCQLTFEIYSITGQLIKRLKLTDGSASIDLHSGCYIIRCEKWSKKIVIN